jgi:tRNA-dihydrouridine synthase C
MSEVTDCLMQYSKFKLASGLQIPGIMPGPMEGVMNPSVCRAFNELELTDMWMTPFLRLTTACPKKSKFVNFMAPFGETGLPVIMQLMGIDAGLLAEAARRAVEAGAIAINLNFACPSNMVVKNGSGGALLREPEKILTIVKRVKEAIPDISLSIKVRMGFESPSDLMKILPRLTECGALDFIAVHFRTVLEGYKKVENGGARLKKVVAAAGELPVIGSGDIFSEGDIQTMRDDYHCAGVMVARGLIRDPYIIKRASGKEGVPDIEAGRKIFYDKLLDIGMDEPVDRWRRSKYIEIGNMVWGRQHPVFEHLLNLPDAELRLFRFRNSNCLR